jgi:hypothetical protein
VEITRELHGGRGVAVWDAAIVAEGSYTLVASLDDGNEIVERTVAQYDVVHLDGNTAPTVTVESPDRSSVLTDGGSPWLVQIVVTDPDPLDTLTVDIDAVRGDEIISIASGQQVTAGSPIGFFWDTSDPTVVAESGNWRIRATVSDGSASRTVTTDRIVVGHDTRPDGTVRPSLAFSDPRIAEIFSEDSTVGVCGRCHIGGDPEIPGQTESISGLDDDYRIYEKVDALDPDAVFEKRALIYRRVVEQRLMPPSSAAHLLDSWPGFSDQDRRLIADWILTGAAP